MVKTHIEIVNLLPVATGHATLLKVLRQLMQRGWFDDEHQASELSKMMQGNVVIDVQALRSRTYIFTFDTYADFLQFILEHG